MCTASWTVKDRDYRLFFNRDERRSRERAKTPETQNRNGLEVVAPLDAEGGGSWIAVNDRGLAAFLLNNYTVKGTALEGAPYRSRGELPILMAEQKEMEAALDRLRSCNLSVYRPFYLGLMGPANDCAVYEWNGELLARVSLDIPFLTTSSYRPREVENYRRGRYLELCGGGDGEGYSDKSLGFHRDRNHENPAFNPFMSRSDAETHCISIVDVDPDRVQFDYYDRVPGEAELKPLNRCSIVRKG